MSEKGNCLPTAKRADCGYAFRFFFFFEVEVCLFILGLFRFVSVFQEFGTGLVMNSCTKVVQFYIWICDYDNLVCQ